MAEEKNAFAGQVDRVPSQLDEEDLKAEIELEIPGSMDAEIVSITEGMEAPEIEITMEEDGGVVVDYSVIMEHNFDVGYDFPFERV